MSATTTEYLPRNTIKTTRFATEQADVPRRGRPTRSWVLVSGVKRLEVYNADKGGTIIEDDNLSNEALEIAAYKKAQAVGKRMGLKLRAVPFSSAFYRA